MIKDAFLFHALFCFISFLFLFWFSRYLNVCPDFFGYVVKKFITSKIGKQIIAVHILSNISISKSNQTMEFGQLIECNMRNIFLEKSCTKKRVYLWINSLKCCSYGWTLALGLHKPVSKKQKKSGTSFPASFSGCFLEKNFPHVMSYRSIFLVWLPLLLETLGNMCIAIICLPVCHAKNCEINLSFLVKPFSYMTKKSEQKRKSFKKENNFLDETKSIFHNF